VIDALLSGHAGSGHRRARRDGLEVETRVVSIFHFRDGRQTERWFYPDDAVAWNSIFGG
jgi:ketosteroid isomerase-like protein